MYGRNEIPEEKATLTDCEPELCIWEEFALLEKAGVRQGCSLGSILFRVIGALHSWGKVAFDSDTIERNAFTGSFRHDSDGTLFAVNFRLRDASSDRFVGYLLIRCGWVVFATTISAWRNGIVCSCDGLWSWRCSVWMCTLVGGLGKYNKFLFICSAIHRFELLRGYWMAKGKLILDLGLFVHCSRINRNKLQTAGGSSSDFYVFGLQTTLFQSKTAHFRLLFRTCMLCCVI